MTFWSLLPWHLSASRQPKAEASKCAADSQPKPSTTYYQVDIDHSQESAKLTLLPHNEALAVQTDKAEQVGCDGVDATSLPGTPYSAPASSDSKLEDSLQEKGKKRGTSKKEASAPAEQTLLISNNNLAVKKNLPVEESVESKAKCLKTPTLPLEDLKATLKVQIDKSKAKTMKTNAGELANNIKEAGEKVSKCRKRRNKLGSYISNQQIKDAVLSRVGNTNKKPQIYFVLSTPKKVPEASPSSDLHSKSKTSLLKYSKVKNKRKRKRLHHTSLETRYKEPNRTTSSNSERMNSRVLPVENKKGIRFFFRGRARSKKSDKSEKRRRRSPRARAGSGGPVTTRKAENGAKVNQLQIGDKQIEITSFNRSCSVDAKKFKKQVDRESIETVNGVGDTPVKPKRKNQRIIGGFDKEQQQQASKTLDVDVIVTKVDSQEKKSVLEKEKQAEESFRIKRSKYLKKVLKKKANSNNLDVEGCPKEIQKKKKVVSDVDVEILPPKVMATKRKLKIEQNPEAKNVEECKRENTPEQQTKSEMQKVEGASVQVCQKSKKLPKKARKLQVNLKSATSRQTKPIQDVTSLIQAADGAPSPEEMIKEAKNKLKAIQQGTVEMPDKHKCRKLKKDPLEQKSMGFENNLDDIATSCKKCKKKKKKDLEQNEIHSSESVLKMAVKQNSKSCETVVVDALPKQNKSCECKESISDPSRTTADTSTDRPVVRKSKRADRKERKLKKKPVSVENMSTEPQRCSNSVQTTSASDMTSRLMVEDLREYKRHPSDQEFIRMTKNQLQTIISQINKKSHLNTSKTLHYKLPSDEEKLLAEKRHLRKEISFSELNLEPVIAYYNTPNSPRRSRTKQPAMVNNFNSLNNFKLPTPRVSSIVRDKKLKARRKEKGSDNNSVVSEAITRKEKNQYISGKRYSINRTLRNFAYSENIIEQSKKALRKNGSSTLGFIVEGVEPPKMIKTSLFPTYLVKRDNSSSTKDLHMTVMSVVEIKPTPLDEIESENFEESQPITKFVSEEKTLDKDFQPSFTLFDESFHNYSREQHRQFSKEFLAATQKCMENRTLLSAAVNILPHHFKYPAVQELQGRSKDSSADKNQMLTFGTTVKGSILPKEEMYRPKIGQSVEQILQVVDINSQDKSFPKQIPDDSIAAKLCKESCTSCLSDDAEKILFFRKQSSSKDDQLRSRSSCDTSIQASLDTFSSTSQFETNLKPIETTNSQDITLLSKITEETSSQNSKETTILNDISAEALCKVEKGNQTSFDNDDVVQLDECVDLTISYATDVRSLHGKHIEVTHIKKEGIDDQLNKISKNMTDSILKVLNLNADQALEGEYIRCYQSPQAVETAASKSKDNADRKKLQKNVLSTKSFCDKNESLAKEHGLFPGSEKIFLINCTTGLNNNTSLEENNNSESAQNTATECTLENICQRKCTCYKRIVRPANIEEDNESRVTVVSFDSKFLKNSVSPKKEPDRVSKKSSCSTYSDKHKRKKKKSESVSTETRSLSKRFSKSSLKNKSNCSLCAKPRKEKRKSSSTTAERVKAPSKEPSEKSNAEPSARRKSSKKSDVSNKSSGSYCSMKEKRKESKDRSKKSSKSDAASDKSVSLCSFGSKKKKGKPKKTPKSSSSTASEQEQSVSAKEEPKLVAKSISEELLVMPTKSEKRKEKSDSIAKKGSDSACSYRSILKAKEVKKSPSKHKHKKQRDAASSTSLCSVPNQKKKSKKERDSISTKSSGSCYSMKPKKKESKKHDKKSSDSQPAGVKSCASECSDKIKKIREDFGKLGEKSYSPHFAKSKDRKEKQESSSRKIRSDDREKVDESFATNVPLKKKDKVESFSKQTRMVCRRLVPPSAVTSSTSINSDYAETERVEIVQCPAKARKEFFKRSFTIGSTSQKNPKMPSKENLSYYKRLGSKLRKNFAGLSEKSSASLVATKYRRRKDKFDLIDHETQMDDVKIYQLQSNSDAYMRDSSKKKSSLEAEEIRHLTSVVKANVLKELEVESLFKKRRSSCMGQKIESKTLEEIIERNILKVLKQKVYPVLHTMKVDASILKLKDISQNISKEISMCKAYLPQDDARQGGDAFSEEKKLKRKEMVKQLIKPDVKCIRFNEDDTPETIGNGKSKDISSIIVQINHPENSDNVEEKSETTACDSGKQLHDKETLRNENNFEISSTGTSKKVPCIKNLTVKTIQKIDMEITSDISNEEKQSDRTINLSTVTHHYSNEEINKEDCNEVEGDNRNTFVGLELAEVETDNISKNTEIVQSIEQSNDVNRRDQIILKPLLLEEKGGENDLALLRKILEEEKREELAILKEPLIMSDDSPSEKSKRDEDSLNKAEDKPNLETSQSSVEPNYNYNIDNCEMLCCIKYQKTNLEVQRKKEKRKKAIMKKIISMIAGEPDLAHLEERLNDLLGISMPQPEKCLKTHESSSTKILEEKDPFRFRKTTQVAYAVSTKKMKLGTKRSFLKANSSSDATTKKNLGTSCTRNRDLKEVFTKSKSATAATETKIKKGDSESNKTLQNVSKPLITYVQPNVKTRAKPKSKMAVSLRPNTPPKNGALDNSRKETKSKTSTKSTISKIPVFKKKQSKTSSPPSNQRKSGCSIPENDPRGDVNKDQQVTADTEPRESLESQTHPANREKAKASSCLYTKNYKNPRDLGSYEIRKRYGENLRNSRRLGRKKKTSSPQIIKIDKGVDQDCNFCYPEESAENERNAVKTVKEKPVCNKENIEDQIPPPFKIKKVDRYSSNKVPQSSKSPEQQSRATCENSKHNVYQTYTLTANHPHITDVFRNKFKAESSVSLLSRDSMLSRDVFSRCVSPNSELSSCSTNTYYRNIFGVKSTSLLKSNFSDEGKLTRGRKIRKRDTRGRPRNADEVCNGGTGLYSTIEQNVKKCCRFVPSKTPEFCCYGQNSIQESVEHLLDRENPPVESSKKRVSRQKGHLLEACQRLKRYECETMDESEINLDCSKNEKLPIKPTKNYESIDRRNSCDQQNYSIRYLFPYNSDREDTVTDDEDSGEGLCKARLKKERSNLEDQTSEELDDSYMVFRCNEDVPVQKRQIKRVDKDDSDEFYKIFAAYNYDIKLDMKYPHARPFLNHTKNLLRSHQIGKMKRFRYSTTSVAHKSELTDSGYASHKSKVFKNLPPKDNVLHKFTLPFDSADKYTAFRPLTVSMFPVNTNNRSKKIEDSRNSSRSHQRKGVSKSKNPSSGRSDSPNRNNIDSSASQSRSKRGDYNRNIQAHLCKCNVKYGLNTETTPFKKADTKPAQVTDDHSSCSSKTGKSFIPVKQRRNIQGTKAPQPEGKGERKLTNLIRSISKQFHASRKMGSDNLKPPCNCSEDERDPPIKTTFKKSRSLFLKKTPANEIKGYKPPCHKVCQSSEQYGADPGLKPRKSSWFKVHRNIEGVKRPRSLKRSPRGATTDSESETKSWRKLKLQRKPSKGKDIAVEMSNVKCNYCAHTFECLQKQVNQCHEYAEKVRKESNLRKDLNQDQDTEYEEIPLCNLLGQRFFRIKEEAKIPAKTVANSSGPKIKILEDPEDEITEVIGTRKITKKPKCKLGTLRKISFVEEVKNEGDAGMPKSKTKGCLGELQALKRIFELPAECTEETCQRLKERFVIPQSTPTPAGCTRETCKNLKKPQEKLVPQAITCTRETCKQLRKQVSSKEKDVVIEPKETLKQDLADSDVEEDITEVLVENKMLPKETSECNLLPEKPENKLELGKDKIKSQDLIDLNDDSITAIKKMLSDMLKHLISESRKSLGELRDVAQSKEKCLSPHSVSVSSETTLIIIKKILDDIFKQLLIDSKKSSKESLRQETAQLSEDSIVSIRRTLDNIIKDLVSESRKTSTGGLEENQDVLAVQASQHLHEDSLTSVKVILDDILGQIFSDSGVAREKLLAGSSETSLPCPLRGTSPVSFQQNVEHASNGSLTPLVQKSDEGLLRGSSQGYEKKPLHLSQENLKHPKILLTAAKQTSDEELLRTSSQLPEKEDECTSPCGISRQDLKHQNNGSLTVTKQETDKDGELLRKSPQDGEYTSQRDQSQKNLEHQKVGSLATMKNRSDQEEGLLRESSQMSGKDSEYISSQQNLEHQHSGSLIMIKKEPEKDEELRESSQVFTVEPAQSQDASDPFHTIKVTSEPLPKHESLQDILNEDLSESTLSKVSTGLSEPSYKQSTSVPDNAVNSSSRASLVLLNEILDKIFERLSNASKEDVRKVLSKTAQTVNLLKSPDTKEKPQLTSADSSWIVLSVEAEDGEKSSSDSLERLVPNYSSTAYRLLTSLSQESVGILRKLLDIEFERISKNRREISTYTDQALEALVEEPPEDIDTHKTNTKITTTMVLETPTPCAIAKIAATDVSLLPKGKPKVHNAKSLPAELLKLECASLALLNSKDLTDNALKKQKSFKEIIIQIPSRTIDADLNNIPPEWLTTLKESLEKIFQALVNQNAQPSTREASAQFSRTLPQPLQLSKNSSVEIQVHMDSPVSFTKETSTQAVVSSLEKLSRKSLQISSTEIVLKVIKPSVKHNDTTTEFGQSQEVIETFQRVVQVSDDSLDVTTKEISTQQCSNASTQSEMAMECINVTCRSMKNVSSESRELFAKTLRDLIRASKNSLGIMKQSLSAQISKTSPQLMFIEDMGSENKLSQKLYKEIVRAEPEKILRTVETDTSTAQLAYSLGDETKMVFISSPQDTSSQFPEVASMISRKSSNIKSAKKSTEVIASTSSSSSFKMKTLERIKSLSKKSSKLSVKSASMNLKSESRELLEKTILNLMKASKLSLVVLSEISAQLIELQNKAPSRDTCSSASYSTCSSEVCQILKQLSRESRHRLRAVLNSLVKASKDSLNALSEEMITQQNQTEPAFSKDSVIVLETALQSLVATSNESLNVLSKVQKNSGQAELLKSSKEECSCERLKTLSCHSKQLLKTILSNLLENSKEPLSALLHHIPEEYTLLEIETLLTDSPEISKEADKKGSAQEMDKELPVSINVTRTCKDLSGSSHKPKGRFRTMFQNYFLHTSKRLLTKKSSPAKILQQKRNMLSAKPQSNSSLNDQLTSNRKYHVWPVIKDDGNKPSSRRSSNLKKGSKISQEQSLTEAAEKLQSRKIQAFKEDSPGKRKALDSLKSSMTDKELFEILLDSYEKEQTIVDRLSNDEDFFQSQLELVKSKESIEALFKEDKQAEDKVYLDSEEKILTLLELSSLSEIASEKPKKKPSTVGKPEKKSSAINRSSKSKLKTIKNKVTSVFQSDEVKEIVAPRDDDPKKWSIEDTCVSKFSKNEDTASIAYPEEENVKVKFNSGSQRFLGDNKLFDIESENVVATQRNAPVQISRQTSDSDPAIVRPTDLGNCFLRGFRYDHVSLGGNTCLQVAHPREQDESECFINFSERDSPLEYLLALGFSIDEASNAIKDEDVKNRLYAAITEARIWINQISTVQGTLLYLVAYKTKPRTMRYFLQMVEAIINRRINNAVKLDAFLKVLEKVEDGDLTMVNILGADKFDDEENEEKAVKKQLRQLFINIYNIASNEAKLKDTKLSKEALMLLRILAAKYRAGLYPHLELIARYIGQGLLHSEVQLEAAMIYLSRLDTTEINLKEFERYCAIRCKNEEKLKAAPNAS